jgi:uncharacterized Fe-S center protein
MASKVYFMDDRYDGLPSSLPAKAQQLFDEANLDGCFEPGDSVAIKCHMGEWYNSAYLRPILIRAVVDRVKEREGQPVVVDTTTAPYYHYGSRSTAQFHLETAAANGFTPQSMGCPVLIADGTYGTEDVRVDIPDGILLKEGYMAKAIADADAMIVVSHFKGHGSGVYGGSIKNKCPDATVCDNMCPVHAMKVKEDHMEWDREACIGCFGHQRPFFRCDVWGREKYDEWRTWFLIAMGDAATGYVRHLGPENVGYISYAIDITPACDCAPGSDRAVLPNLGVLASRDMIAIDVAALDLADKAPGIPGSMAEEKKVMEPGAEKFTGIVGMSQWVTANSAVGRSVGSKEYELIEPPVSDDEAAYCFPAFSPKRPSGYYLAKGVAKFGTWIPEGGFKYNKAPSILFTDLTKR